MLYHHPPFFFSDLFELGYQAVGELDARLATVADWEEPFKKGVVYYLGEHGYAACCFEMCRTKSPRPPADRRVEPVQAG